MDWGIRGLERLAASDIVVVVDVLRFSSSVIDAIAAGQTVPLDASAHADTHGGADATAHADSHGELDATAHADTQGGVDATAHAASWNGAAIAARAAEPAPQPTVVLGGLRNAAAVAGAVLAEQHRRGARTSVAVIAAGERTSREPGADLRFAVEDLLGAGAVIDALGALGLDHTSPEAAAACEAFRGLRAATRHLLAASGSGQALLARGAGDEVRAAAEVDASASVPILRDGVFEAYLSRA